MSNLQSIPLCRDFTDPDATPEFAQGPSAPLVMKGSPVGIRASA
jgi:hypothetical protein